MICTTVSATRTKPSIEEINGRYSARHILN